MEERIPSNRPIVIMLYFKFGSLYSKIKGDWEFLAEQNKLSYDFYQHDMKEEDCIPQYFNTKNSFPFFILIQKQQYYGQFYYHMIDVERMIKNSNTLEYQPIPRNTIFKRILKYAMNWKNQQFIIAGLVTLLIGGMTYFRLGIYKDEIPHKD